MISEWQNYYIRLTERLRNLPVESEWLEYKSNNTASLQVILLPSK